MMNIKFRGFSISAKRWIYGYAWIVPEVNLYYILTGKINVRDCSVEKYEVYPESVGQYTGLKDKNGKEIYEGDVIQTYEKNGELFTEELDAIEWIANNEGCYGIGWGLLPSIFIYEVIGNIYENPELLNS